MQGNRGPRPEQQNHGPPRQQPNIQQEKQRNPQGNDSNGQHAEAGEQSSPNDAFTIDLQDFKKPGEKTYTQRSRLFVGNLPTGTSEADETKTLADIAKAELDDTIFLGRQIRVRFATHGAALMIKNLPQYVSNELLEEAFSMFGPIERAIVIVNDRGWPTGKGIVEFANKPSARKALDRCGDGAFLLTAFPRPITVEPMEQLDEDEGLPERLINKNPLYHKEREQPPRFAQPGSFEYEYAMRWKALMEMEKQQYEQVDRNIKEAKEKLETELEAARHEHQVMLMRQDLLRRQEELRRMEEAHSQEVQKRKQMELRQEEERRRREEDLRAHSEELMRRQQGQGGNFTEKGLGMNRNMNTGMSGNPTTPVSTSMTSSEGTGNNPGGLPLPFPRPAPNDFGAKRRRF
ncbi:hypothetical protein DNTS_003424 [Danionella cerebrum]|uniref:RRM domain-containing protein n=1 Tax=Danionella cerebrum TaxID=2873325 RepID=A0A553PR88_9TELE|nr:hypothetical protein DNTS_003424 [Danionella translucida]